MSEWLPILLVLLLAGVPNLWRGREELARRCTRMPLLQPYRNGWYLACLAIYLLFPAVSFLLLVILSASLVAPVSTLQPTFSLTLLLYAIGFGIAFQGVVRGRPLEIPTLGAIDIGKYHRALIKYGYVQIQKGEAEKTANFLDDLKQELQQFDSKQLRERLQSYLEPYLQEAKAGDRVLDYPERISRAISMRDARKRAKEIADLMREIERRDLPGILYRLECDRTLKKYFSRWKPKIPRD